uniref:Methylenetetrahydrofolate reductase n=1 Tax=Macrostomum lignano TaxID=282301 RepID=A0A1I8FQ83_9PLAT
KSFAWPNFLNYKCQSVSQEILNPKQYTFLENSAPCQKTRAPLPRCRLKRSSSRRSRSGPQPPTSRQYRPLATRIRRRIEKGRRWFSCEFFPPRTPGGRCEPRLQVRQLRQGPAAVLRRHLAPGRNPAGDSPTSSTSVASAMLNYCGHRHRAAPDLRRPDRGSAGARAGSRKVARTQKHPGAARGDLPEDADGNPGGASAAAIGGPAFASDLVRLIRRRYGSFFCIGVAGLPGGPPEGRQLREDLRRLKEKVDAGGEFIITQLFFESADFLRFVSDCRRGYQSLRHIVKLSKLTVPDSMLRVIEPIRDNDEAIRNYGIAQCTQMCQELLQSGQVHGIHFYTLNRDAATIRILKNIGLWREDLPRPLPWQPSANYERCAEAVRPCSGPGGPPATCTGPGTGMTIPTAGGAPIRASKQERLRMWGSEPTSEPDIWRVCSPATCPGNQSARTVSESPGCPGATKEPLPSSSESSEAAKARQRLAGLSERGLLATNTCCGSTTRLHGWGGSGGFVYQRAYLEFFLPGCRLPALQVSRGIGTEQPRWRRVSFHIADRSGNVNLCELLGAHRPHLGRLPRLGGRSAHLGRLYEEGSPSRRLIESVAETYLLVALVDNDFTEDSVLWDLTDQVARRPTARTRWSSLRKLQCRVSPRGLPRATVRPGTPRGDHLRGFAVEVCAAPEAEGGWPDFDCATGLFAEMFNGE